MHRTPTISLYCIIDSLCTVLKKHSPESWWRIGKDDRACLILQIATLILNWAISITRGPFILFFVYWSQVTSTKVGKLYYLHLTAGKNQVQRRDMTCWRSYAKPMQRWTQNPGLDSHSGFLSTGLCSLHQKGLQNQDLHSAYSHGSEQGRERRWYRNPLIPT